MSTHDPSERVPIAEVTDLMKAGEPLPFRVLDAQARLLLNEGQVLVSERQIELLIERGAWAEREVVAELRRRAAGESRPGGLQRSATLFDHWEHALWDLDALLRKLAKGEALAADAHGCIDALMRLVERDADIALFLAVRQEDRRFALYPLAHALHCGVLALVAARQLGWPPARQHGLAGAALTMNVGMLELQAHMAEQDEPPTARQLEQIRSHPARAVALLGQAGIADPAWLRAVIEHHERADGSGYPRGLKEVADESRLLRMADVYMAKITPRAKRPPLAPQVASRQLFQQEPGSPLAMAFIKAIGVHPPGALVQLASGEVAVVTRRGTTGPAPTVATLSDRKGNPSVNTQAIDTGQSGHAITGPCAAGHRFLRVLPERVYGIVAP